jgi:hypothetical protein
VLLPTADEVLAAKADAAARFGRPEALLVRMSAPIDFAILVAPLNLDAYCQLTDEQGADLATGSLNAVHRQRLWPSIEIVTEKLARKPAAAQEIVRKLNVRAGYRPGNPSVELLADRMVRAAVDADIIPGLARAVADKIVAATPGAELWAIEGPGPLSCVMQTPEGDVWLAAQTAKHKALLETNKRIVRAQLDFALQAVVWSARVLDADLFQDQPALSRDLHAAYDILGGEGADTTSRSF